MHAKLFLLMALTWVATCPIPAVSQSLPEDVKARRAAVHALKVGDSEILVRQAMHGCEERDMHSLTNKYVRLCQPLAGLRAAAWLVYTNQGEEFYAVAVFSEEKMLVDLLSFIPSSHLVPMVHGTYAERLQSIKAGMNTDDVYQLLGPDTPMHYYRSTAGKWSVNLLYQGAGGDVWIYTVDAGSGEITGVQLQHVYLPNG